MTDDCNGVIPAQRVRRLKQPAMIDCGSHDENGSPSRLTVLPLVDGDRVAGLEIRCSCGASVIVECEYESEEGS